MLLGIVIPYYNITFFEETLQSLANQTNKNFKVYIGNDASPDNPITLINSYQDDLNITYLKFEKNLGKNSLTTQWDRCIKMVQEEKWIMILGDDDVLDCSVVNSFYDQFEVFNNKSRVVRFATRTISEKTNSISDIFEHPVWERSEDSFYRKFRWLTRSSLSEYIFERDSYLNHKFFPYPLAWHSDDRAWLEFSENTPIFTINEAVVFIRNSSISISGKTDNENLKNLAAISFYKYIIGNKLPYFNKEQRIFLFRAGENEILKSRRLNFQEWLFLIYHYSKNFDANSFKNLLKRFLKSALNR